ncbi:mitochondrial large subunit ribosomal protein L23 [Pseudohyphozyma bogoriensis]|nr:mitochondrial large subunit ribosomal protein L23 [Pseudohyphozyma bogoriensis]
MQAILRGTRALSLAARSTSAAPTPSTSAVRALATLADPSPAAAAAARPAESKIRYIVPEPVEKKASPRYSAKSSRVKGRTASSARKALSETADGAPATTGEVKIFLPSVFMRLVRNTGEYEHDPFTATFRTDLRLTKPDISNYLKNVYGLSITSIRTMNYLSKMKRNPVGGGYSRAGGFKNYKKVLVTLTEPFWYPEERSREWCNEHFQRDQMEEMRDRKMLRLGDGQKYAVGAMRYRGAGKSRAEVERLAAIATGGGQVDGPSDGKAAQKLPTGLKKKRNVITSRAERLSEGHQRIEDEVSRLRESGW